MTCTKRVMFRMEGTTEQNQGWEKMTIFFNHFELVTDCIATYNIIFKNHYCSHCCHHQHLVSLRNRTAPRNGRQRNVSNMSRLSLANYVAIFTWHYCVLVFNKKICLKEDEIWWKIISKKILSHLSHKVCHLLSSAFRMHKIKLTNVTVTLPQLQVHWTLLSPTCCFKKSLWAGEKIYSHETKMVIIHYNFIEHIITLLNQTTKT